MKKIISLLMCAVVVLSFSSCGEEVSSFVSISPAPETMMVGETLSLKGDYTYDDKRYVFEWESTNTRVATVVSRTGSEEVSYSEAVVTAQARGVVTIICKVYTRGINAKPIYAKLYLQVITEDDFPEAQDFEVDDFEVRLDIDDTYQVNVHPLPENSVIKSDIEYTTTDRNIATVSKEGLVTAHAKGEAVIEVNCMGKNVAIFLTVLDIPENINFKVNSNGKYEEPGETIEMKPGDAFKYTASLPYQSEDAKTVSYSCSDTSVVSFSGGELRALKSGSATLRIYCTEYPELYKTYKINVASEENSDQSSENSQAQ